MIRRLATIGFVIAACAIVVVLAGAGGKSESGKTIKIAFSNAFGLTEGGDLRVGGVIAGSTDTFDVSKGPECQLGQPNREPKRTCAIVTAKVTEPGFASFRKDATCAIRQQSLIGEYYVDCQPGSDKQVLPSNAIIPDTKTASTIPTDLVNNILRRPYRDRLRLIIAELGTGLAGRPDDIAKLLKQAHPGLRETDKTLKILASQTRIIKNFISNSDIVVAQLHRKENEVARWVRTAGRTAEISATRRAAIAAGFQKLPTFLDELRPTMTALGQLTDAQTPVLQKLRQSAPQLTLLFTRLGPFANASRPAFRSLGSLSVVGKKAFGDARDEIATLKALAADAPGTFKPLRQFLQTLDNRKRSFDKDVRATASAPPAPDPTKANGRGFTGMEGIWNFFYWQTLSINEFDSISHYLRVLAIDQPNCSPYTADARPGGTNSNAAAARQCASYLGPFQPGVTAPDPTANGGAAAATASKKPVAKRGAPRGRGQPEAPPVKGQPDYSHPNPTLPPSVQELLNHLTNNPPAGGGGGGNPVPSLPGVNLPPLPGVDANQALNYLLGP
jgi:ABC-type transporter Mla subunit MlaD